MQIVKQFVCLGFFMMCASGSAWADAVAPIDTAAKQAFILDANTNTELYAKNADTPMPPSSMSKMMTIYMVFEALHDGKIKLDDTMPVSEHAWKQEGSRMFLNVGQRARVEDLIRGVVIQSGNDAAVTFAEGLGGSEENFATMLNAKATELGLKNSHFINATGLPDPQHYSTARDLAILALAINKNFPEFYHYFSELDFTYNNIKQGNRNPLLYRGINVDGLKTGHTDAGGFGLTASALRDGRRLIMVLNGLDSMQARADESAKMLDWAYREYGLYPIAKADDKIAEVKVSLGEKKTVALVLAKDVTLTLPHSVRAGVTVKADVMQPVDAPVAKGQPIGQYIVTIPGQPALSLPLLAAENVPRLGFFARISYKLHALLHKES